MAGTCGGGGWSVAAAARRGASRVQVVLGWCLGASEWCLFVQAGTTAGPLKPPAPASLRRFPATSAVSRATPPRDGRTWPGRWGSSRPRAWLLDGKRRAAVTDQAREVRKLAGKGQRQDAASAQAVAVARWRRRQRRLPSASQPRRAACYGLWSSLRASLARRGPAAHGPGLARAGLQRPAGCTQRNQDTPAARSDVGPRAALVLPLSLRCRRCHAQAHWQSGVHPQRVQVQQLSQARQLGAAGRAGGQGFGCQARLRRRLYSRRRA